MWFHDSIACVWEEGIKPGIEDARYLPVRIDRMVCYEPLGVRFIWFSRAYGEKFGKSVLKSCPFDFESLQPLLY